jgi:hypothetical protein
MLLNDACHSIDSLNMGVILEIVKFPYYPIRRKPQERFDDAAFHLISESPGDSRSRCPRRSAGRAKGKKAQSS